MGLFQIISLAGVDMGMHEGKTPEDAIESMHRDAGYASTEDAAARTGASAAALRRGVRVIPVYVYDYDTARAIRAATRAEYDASAEQAERDGGAGVVTIDGRACYVQVG